VYEHYVNQAPAMRVKSKETFWRELKKIVAVKAHQIRRVGFFEGKSVQMVEFPKLEDCRRAFREYMGDEEWRFLEEDGGESAESEVIPTNPSVGAIQSSMAAVGSQQRGEVDSARQFTNDRLRIPTDRKSLEAFESALGKFATARR
jgi:hypothetical protein